MSEMTKKQRELVEEFAKISNEKGYCYTIYFMVGALAFSKEAVEMAESEKILKDIITIANDTNSEEEFFRQVTMKYVPEMYKVDSTT